MLAPRKVFLWIDGRPTGRSVLAFHRLVVVVDYAGKYTVNKYSLFQ